MAPSRIPARTARYQNSRHPPPGLCIGVPARAPVLQSTGFHRRSSTRTGGEEIAEAKVDDLDVPGFTDEYILNFKVSVDDAVPMAVV